MIRRLLEKAVVRIPKDRAEGFRSEVADENLGRLVIGGALLSLVELGVLVSIIGLGTRMYPYPLAVVLFNLATAPLFLLLRGRPGRPGLKRSLVHLAVLFYLGWACIFTWANRASSPGLGMNVLFSPYLLMVYGIAIVICLEPAWSALLYLASNALFMALMPFGALSARDVSINAWNALALNLFAWLTSRMIFASRLRTHIDRSMIHEKNRELEAERNNLAGALASVKQLSGLLPICSSCKKVRDDNGYWLQVEEYIARRSDATFTHGLCPDCMEKYYPEQEK